MSDRSRPRLAVGPDPIAVGACATDAHDHRTRPRPGTERRALLGAMGLKGCLFAIGVIGGIAFGSLALLADAAHVAFDAVALVVAVVGVVLTGRPVSRRHSFGLPRAEVLAAHVSALLMLAAGAMIVAEAVARLRAPEPVDGAGLAAVAALGLSFNATSAGLVHRHAGHSLNMRAAFAHLATDAVGCLASLGAGLAILAWGWVSADALASLITAVLILAIGARLLRDSTGILLEGTPRQLDPREVLAAIRGVNGVLDVHHLHLWSLASDDPACTAHVVLEGTPSLAGAEQASQAVKSELARRFDLTNVTLELECAAGQQPGPAVTADPPRARHG